MRVLKDGLVNWFLCAVIMACLVLAAGCGTVAAVPGPARQLTLDLGGGVAMKLLLIRPGEFMMGSPNSEPARDPDEGPQHWVRITRPFYMGVTEVTNAQYDQFVKESGYDGSGDADSDYMRHHRDWSQYASPAADYPVVCVSWNNAQAFCRWLAQESSMTVRLPTQAEWEYACRAGTQTRFSFADTDAQLGDYAWYIGNSNNQTRPVGQKKPNAWGLHDMHGNVWEWCQDWYGSYPTGAVDDPTGPTNGEYPVGRGGSWNNDPRYCRSANRRRRNPTLSSYCNGFRVVASLRP